MPSVLKTILVAAALCLVGNARAEDGGLNRTVTVDIAPQKVATALIQLSNQAAIQVLMPGVVVDKQATRGVRGKMSVEQAVIKLLEGTNLRFRPAGENIIGIEAVSTQPPPKPVQAAPAQIALAQATSDSREEAGVNNAVNETAADDELQTDAKGIPEIHVEGSRILNMDVKRSVDDAQPYVIFDRARIERSGAANLEDFFKRNLTMSTRGRSNNQDPNGGRGQQSEVNLRGLGANQTLILVDGRRVAGVNNLGNPAQNDINGIPLSAIERIEVLPTTASGIYGGSATGGAINIIMRRDYAGAEATGTYGNTFDSDAATRRFDMAGGFSFEGGKSNVLLTASFADQNELTVGDRQFMQRGRAAILANNPTFILDSGRPPLGATTNIRSADGSPLFGPGTSDITFVPQGYAGNGGLAPLQANAGHYNFALSDTSQLGGPGARESLVAVPTVKTASITLRREFSPRLQAFVEGSGTESSSYFTQNFASGFGEIAASAPNNPFGQSILVNAPVDVAGQRATSDSTTNRMAAGVIVKLPRRWTAGADYTLSTSRLSYSFPSLVFADGAIADGSVDVLRDLQLYPADLSDYLGPPVINSIRPFRTRLQNGSARVSGPAFTLPAGPVVVTGLLEHRREAFLEGVSNEVGDRVVYPERSQSVSSGYLEMQIPLLAARDKHSETGALDMQVAVRHDDYTTHAVTGFLYEFSDPPAHVTSEARSTDPTLGLRYRPLPGLMLRASYGTGFLPPTVTQLVPQPPNETVSPGTGGFFDPRRGGENLFSVMATRGGSPGLAPEESESVSAGAVLTPAGVPGLRLSLDYTRIRKTDNITRLSVQTIIDNEALFPGRVTRATPASNDPFGVGSIESVDATLANISSAEVEAYDLSADYTLATRAMGSLEFSARATRQTHYKQQLIPGSAVLELVGITSGNPLKTKGNLGLVWSHRGWTLGWNARYYDSYLVADPLAPSSGVVFQNQGSRAVPSQSYHDFFAAYDLSAAPLGRTEIRLGVDNVFNRQPPLDLGNDALPYSPLGDPRLAGYYLSVKTEF